jgi:hypothetical protein
MSGPANNPNNRSRWGSILSGAVAGLESRLDSILADDDQASARQRAEETARQEKLKLKQNALKAEQGTFRWLICRFGANWSLQLPRERLLGDDQAIASKSGWLKPW